MKIAIISDLHWGCRNGNPLFYNYFEKFYDDFLGFLKENQINEVCVLGDTFDSRKSINLRTLSAAKRIFFGKFYASNINLHVIVGNHDIHYRESLELSSPELLLSSYSNIRIYDTPKVIEFDGTTISMIPWICKENEGDILDFMFNTNTDLCFGHFEIASYPMYKGIMSEGGMDSNIFQKYELVCSGHYHTRSKRDNIVYVGAPYEITWQDHDDPRGFHVFDTDTRKLEFHKNPHSIFVKLEYDETKPINLDDINVEDCFVRLIVNNKNDLYLYDTFVNKLYNKKCYEIKIVEDILDTISGEVSNDVDLEDTLDVLSNYVKSIGLNDVDTTQLDGFMKTLYLEAINDSVV